MGLSAALLLLNPGKAPALELGENVQVHGFISQSLAHTTDNSIGGGSNDDVATDLRELGINLSWRPNSDWMVSAQALSRWAGATDEGQLRLDYGFVARNLYSEDGTQIGLSVGKVKNPLGFYNTTRDVAHTRPGILMPQSIYLERVRNFYLAAPGVSLHGLHTLENSEVNWTLSAVQPEADDVDLEYLFLLRDWSGHYEGRPSWLGQVMLDRDGGRWRLGLSLGDIGIRYKPGSITDPIKMGESDLQTWIVSAQHNSENWSLTAEYSQTLNEGNGYGLSFANQPNTVEAWYVQGTWRPNQDLSVYLRRDAFFLDKEDKNGADFSNQTGGRPGHLIYGKGITLGVRRELGPWAVWLEWGRVDGTVWLSPQETPLNRQNKDWDMLLLQAAWRF